MKRLLAALLAFGLSGPGFAAEARVPALPPLDAPLAAPAAPFPASSAAQFFAGSQRIVDLGGQLLSGWTLDTARRNPAAEVHAVNREQEPPVELVREGFGVPNVHARQYDFFRPPAGHPTGDRVVLNSPNFGGLPDAASADRFARMIDEHLEPGGRFYMHADDLWLVSIQEMALHVRLSLAITPELERRREAAVRALERRFGKGNVSAVPLDGYDPAGALNAPGGYVLQVRKPRR